MLTNREYQPQFKYETNQQKVVRWSRISQLQRYAEELKQFTRENQEPAV